MKIGMNLLLWATDVTPEHYPALERIKRSGFDGVEVPIFGGDDAHYRRLGMVLNDLGLKASVVTVVTPEANPIDPDPVVRDRATERLNRIVRQASLLGADVVCGPIHQPLGVFSGAGPTEAELNRAAEVHRAVAETARQHQVMLAMESLNRFECYIFNTIKAGAAHVARVDHPNFRIMYDTFHANIEEADLVDAYNDHAAVIAHIHISNNDRGVPGRGHIDFAALFRAAKNSGYGQWLTIEAFGRALPDLVEPTRVWRDFFGSADEVVEEGGRFIAEGWAKV